ncbi:hypothetical protein SISSUDRAFT_974467, partial [Sistotremastrum suecicum HHB10207 ss-3]
VLTKVGMSDCTPKSTPMRAGLELRKSATDASEAEEILMNGCSYLCVVGSIMYAVVGT